MISAFILPIGLLIAIISWVVISRFVRRQLIRRQQEVASRGEYCEGTIVAIQRPFMLGSCTRLYFDFEPPGMDRPLRVCHVDRRAVGESTTPLPQTGALVTVRYLREQPRRAIIGKLVALVVKPA